MGGDWVQVYRSLLGHPVFQDDWLCRLFLWCLLKANYKPTVWKGQELDVGQFITGRMRASEELGVSPSKWYRGMEMLKNPPYSVITLKSNRDWTTVTVCNFKAYQNGSQKSEQPADSQRTASGQPADTDKRNSIREEGKNGIKEDTAAAAAGNPKPPPTKPRSDAELLDWVRWWNGLHEQGLVHAACKEEPVSQAVVTGWNRVKRCVELRELLADRTAIERRIRETDLAGAAWWSLDAMLGGKNGDGQYKLAKLLNGGYEFLGEKRSRRSDPRGNYEAGQRYLKMLQGGGDEA